MHPFNNLSSHVSMFGRTLRFAAAVEVSKPTSTQLAFMLLSVEVGGLGLQIPLLLPVLVMLAWKKQSIPKYLLTYDPTNDSTDPYSTDTPLRLVMIHPSPRLWVGYAGVLSSHSASSTHFR